MSASRRGFTLIEVMTVVVLISLLAALAGMRLVGNANRAKVKIARAVVKGTLSTALENFYLDNSFYPTTDQGLEALVEKPTSPPEPTDYPDDGYLKEIELDPWNMPYQYVCPGAHNERGYDLWSVGPDRQSGTADDIVNWRRK
ncbi:type II secretion system major pseudopilin GspG [Candidatus Sumerlaeota bacterium]|nr:type II secretion system major pseudopilin GspG [Candidatus Sumerlaeota bacterium]